MPKGEVSNCERSEPCSIADVSPGRTTMPRRRTCCHFSCKMSAPLPILIPLLASLFLSVSAVEIRLVSSAESLQAALADTSVAEILVAGPLQLAAPVFNATPAGRLVLERDVVLRGVAAGAGLHVDRAGEGSREPPGEGWLQWSKRISFISLVLKGLMVIDPKIENISHARRFTLWNGERLFRAENETLSGELFLKNCSFEIDPELEYFMRYNIQRFISYGDIQGLDDFRKPRKSPTNFVLSGSAIAPLFESELEMTVMDMLLYSMNIFLISSREGLPAHTLVLWGNNNMYFLWFYAVGFYVFDCHMTFPTDTLAIARELTSAEDRMFILGGDIIDGGAAAASLRAAVVGEFQGTERDDCQSIYKTDPTWAKAAEQQGMELPDSFNRFLLGRDYVGTMNVTRSGRPCLAWRDIDLPGAEDEFSGIEGNACRNPTSSGLKAQHGVWCFVDSANSSWRGTSWEDDISWEELIGGRSNWSKYDWEYCDVPVCEDAEVGAELQSCADGPKSITGAGPWKVNVSYDGSPCWNWSEIALLRHTFGRIDDNYCRNPEELGVLSRVGPLFMGNWATAVEPWCFTWRSLRIAKCSVPKCEDLAALPGPGLPEPQTPLLAEADSEEGIPRATEQDQGPWLVVAGATSGAVAAALALITAVLYFRRQKKTKRGWHTSALPHSKTDVELADSEITSIESASLSRSASSKGYSHASDVETRSAVSVSKSSSITEVLQSFAVEILPQSPDALGLVKLLNYIGSGVSSRVERCSWRDSDACCKIVKLNEVWDEVMAYKILFGVEAGLLASLCHPNIVQTYKIYHVMDGHLGSVHRDGVQAIWLIQELCAGGNLASKKDEIMQSKEPLLVMLTLFRQVALALRFLHEEMAIVHGDLKPENVLLKTDASGTFSAKVADFGLSHVMHDRKHYQPEKLYGDVKFMAPEAIFEKVVSPAMDIWSLGMLIFDMVDPGGVAPEGLSSFFKVPVDVVLPHGTPAPIQDLVKKCTNRNAEQRPSAGEVINELSDILNRMAGSSRSPSPEPCRPSPASGQSSYSRVVGYYRTRFNGCDPTEADNQYLLPRHQ